MFSFRNIFRSEPLRLRLEQIPSYLESKETKSRKKAFLDRIKPCFSGLRNMLDSLSSKTSSNNYSNMLKNKFCARSISIIDSLGNPETAYSCREAIKEIGNIDIKEFRHLHAFNDDMKSIAASINSITRETEETLKLIESSDSFRKTSDAEGKFKRITSLAHGSAMLEKEMAQINCKLVEIEKSLRGKARELAEFSAREEFRRVESMDEELKYIEKNKATIKQKVVEEFAGIDRPMRKFRHAKTFENMPKECRDALDKYIYSGEALFSDNDLLIKKILENMKRAAETKEMEVEEKKYHRIMDILRNTGLLESLRDHYLSLVKKSSQLKEEREKYSGIAAEKRHMKNEISAMEKEIPALKWKLEAVTKKKQEKEKEMATQAKELEAALREILGHEVILSEN